MGEHADYIIDQMIDQWAFGGSSRRRSKGYQAGSGKGQWRTASGEVVPMNEMSLAHLRAAATKCRATGNTGKLADLEKAIAAKVEDYFDPVRGSD